MQTSRIAGLALALTGLVLALTVPSYAVPAASPAPEPSQVVPLGMFGVALAGMMLRARKRSKDRD